MVGATGVVGELLLRILEQRQTRLGRLRPLASARSAGQIVRFHDADLQVVEATPDAFVDIDVVFFAATGSLSKSLAPAAVERGAVVIDKSSTWRMAEHVPLVVPEINADALERHQGLIACPNCSTIGMVMALAPLHRVFGLRRVTVTTMQAASGAGRNGIDELARQLADPHAPATVFPRRLAGDVLPQCDSFDATRDDGLTAEERKLVEETRKILGLPELEVEPTCVRVPVAVGHSASITIETTAPVDLAAARQALADFAGVRVVDDPAHANYPTAANVAGTDEVLVGRLRQTGTHRLSLWQVADNLRKGAATNAVQILEALGIER